jgi:hypothetical protein
MIRTRVQGRKITSDSELEKIKNNFQAELRKKRFQ